jgi:hypothetical protein
LRRCWATEHAREASRWRPPTACLDRRGRGSRASQRIDCRSLRRSRGFTRQCATPARPADRAASDNPPAAETGPGAERSSTTGGAGSAARAAFRRSGREAD